MVPGYRETQLNDVDTESSHLYGQRKDTKSTICGRRIFHLQSWGRLADVNISFTDGGKENNGQM